MSSAAVKYILDTVIEELQKNENRTFIYVEMAFFTRWWRQQSEATKDIVSRELHVLPYVYRISTDDIFVV